MQKINWYPGHMLKAKKEITTQLKHTDLIIEIVDSRVPLSSRNEMLADITKGKDRLIIFSKRDFVNEQELKSFAEKHYSGFDYIFADLSNTAGVEKVEAKIEKAAFKIVEKYAKKGISKTIHCMIIGMPNVGKSTFINFLSKKKKTITGNRPGVTKQQQHIKVNDFLDVIDTPGVLVPKIESNEIGYRLVLCSLIKDEVVQSQSVAVYLLKVLRQYYPKNLEKRYNLTDAANMDINDMYDEIGANIGALLRNREVDYDRVTNTVINDFRKQKLGYIILDGKKLDEEIL